jgi:SSS family solute:Na+ symporter
MGLATSLVATFANNISGFSAAWVLGIYRPTIWPGGDERHYVWMGRLATATAILLSIGGAYVALEYQSIMEYMQMIFSTFNAPIFALVMLAALAPARAAGWQDSSAVWRAPFCIRRWLMRMCSITGAR